MAKAKKYACILMDIQMPVMDGYDATKAIREFNQTVPIVALTASALLEKREKTLMAGMDDFVSKPFRPDELYSALIRYKSGQRNLSP
ncbi:MAG: response regulator [Bacteroidota bacterium]|nr:response regulator [Bacteroidota bacterium]MDX5430960.1 response regulator [Bacteroidota bacterium]MDX5469711.1 response regulator [Bacteroidota bacterium]